MAKAHSQLDKEPEPEAQFEVECILDSRINQNTQTPEFLVKWVGYSAIWNSWEPESSFCSPFPVEQFKTSKQSKKIETFRGEEILSVNVGASASALLPPLPFVSVSPPPFHSSSSYPVISSLNVESLPNNNGRSIEDLYKNLTKHPKSQNASTRDVGKGDSDPAVERRLVEASANRSNFAEAMKKFQQILDLASSASIKIVNNVDLVPPPADFNYICSMVFGDGVPKPESSFLIGCECGPGGCVSGSCLCIAQNENGEPVYSGDGAILIDQGPIYECNAKCPCPNSCPNRVIQRGRTAKLVISRYSNGKGWGVQADEPIRKGAFLDLYLGEVITASEAVVRYERAETGEDSYLFDLDFNYEVGAESDFTIDARTQGNVTHFLNHSCDPNLRVHPYFCDSWDPRLHYLAFFTTRDIQCGEELCFDYLGFYNAAGPSSRPNAPVRPSTAKSSLRCVCGSQNCRSFIY